MSYTYRIRERMFQGAKVPCNFRSRERKFQGAKVPGSESSTYGTFALGSESTWERKFQLPYGPTYRGHRDYRPVLSLQSLTEPLHA